MKQILKSFLTVMWLAQVLMSCRTSDHLQVERSTQHVEHRREAAIDTVSEHSADTVYITVEKGDSSIRITERKVHWREKVRVQRDTVVVYARADTIVKTVSAKAQPPRSPTLLAPLLALVLILTAVMAVLVFTIKQIKL